MLMNISSARKKIADPPIHVPILIGMVGDGQLGRIFALEARRIGYRLVVLDAGDATPAAQGAVFDAEWMKHHPCGGGRPDRDHPTSP